MLLQLASSCCPGALGVYLWPQGGQSGGLQGSSTVNIAVMNIHVQVLGTRGTAGHIQLYKKTVRSGQSLPSFHHLPSPLTVALVGVSSPLAVASHPSPLCCGTCPSTSGRLQPVRPLEAIHTLRRSPHWLCGGRTQRRAAKAPWVGCGLYLDGRKQEEAGQEWAGRVPQGQ